MSVLKSILIGLITIPLVVLMGILHGESVTAIIVGSAVMWPVFSFFVWLDAKIPQEKLDKWLGVE